MSAIIEIAPQGDLVVSVGTGDAQKLARISSTLMRLASPVFNVMLGHSFKEGQSTFDASHPLQLPDDHPTATVNLFRVLHYGRDQVDRDAEHWLHDLITLCDKYQCVSSIKDFLNVTSASYDWHLKDVERMVIASLMDDAVSFKHYSEIVVRTPRRRVEEGLHEDLMQLLPCGMLDQLVEYRMKAHADYRDKAYDLCAKIYIFNDEHYCSYSDRVCTSACLTRLHERLFASGTLTEKVDEDCTLGCMASELCKWQDECDSVCTRPDCQEGCEEYQGTRIFGLAMEIAAMIELGTRAHCEVCLNCFQKGQFKFTCECGHDCYRD